MATARTNRKRYCQVSWCAEDVQTLRPHWSAAKCNAFLDDNECVVQDRMIEVGRNAIEDLLRCCGEEE